jgi:tRNA(fMet)-specific endonuclease VapC
VTQRYLLDTGPAFDFLFKRRNVDFRVEAARKNGGKIGICIPVLGESAGGLDASGSREAYWEIAKRRLAKLICWPYDRAAAYEYGRIYADLKRRGRPMQQIDIQIAAIALTLGNCTVISTDSDLSAIQGLPVENWSVPPNHNAP